MTEQDRARIEAICQRLSIAFANAADRHDAAGLSGTFAVDGQFDRRGEVVKGRAAIAASMADWSPDMVLRHVCSNLLVEVQDENNATGITYATVWRHPPEKKAERKGKVAPLTQPAALVEYHDKYVRTEEGWRIAYRRTVPVFAA